jgi:LPS O-antigen subunit length determinant protein (WzzB/FepE family)
MSVDTENLRSLSPNLSRFLEFEREIEESIRQEDDLRRQELEETKRQREKRARKKRLKRLRQVQQQ